MKKLKLNTLNKLYLLILLGMIIATGLRIHRYHRSSRYYYATSFTAPMTYPVFVQQAYLILAGGMNVSISCQDVNDGYQMKWGETETNLSTNSLNRLPVALVIKYASYRDQTFYADSIPLPAVLIDSIFKTAEQKGITRKREAVGNDGTPPLSFLIGIANKGNMVVWLQGKKYERKLFTCQLKTIRPKEDQEYGDKHYPPATYFDHFRVSDEYKRAVSRGADNKANYADSTTHYLEHDYLWR